MYVQLFDSIGWGNVGKIAGSNSFSALFTDTAITSVNDLPIQNYTPQIQINTMVTDTQHWVLLVDTFIATGGEQFVSIGNFKTDAQTQTQLVKTVNNLPEVAYYFMDDVSLIDLDEVGIEEVERNKLVVYPNPASTEITFEYFNVAANSKIVVYDYLGKEIIIKQVLNENGKLVIDVHELTNGLYLYKVISEVGSVKSIGKFNIIQQH
ncbi:MAG: hypothetical protein RJA07_945 [Bacteroidota bacterium]|jgi:hypothetical protein